jgi:hypothetical protein
MRMCRLVIAVLLAVSFAALPIAAGMARVQAMSSEMSMDASPDDCPCCDAAHKCPADACMVKCFNVSAIAIATPTVAAPLPPLFDPIGSLPWMAFLPRPDPPPPRS